MKLLLIYLFTVNALGFLVMLIDKYKAAKNLWRIPEATLLGIAAIGGSFGSLLGMHLAHHKTKHPKFSVGIPVLFSIHTVLAVIFFTVII